MEGGFTVGVSDVYQLGLVLYNVLTGKPALSEADGPPLEAIHSGYFLDILFYFILFYFILFYFILFYFILFYFILFYFILFYFILFYFILFYFILFYFT